MTTTHPEGWQVGMTIVVVSSHNRVKPYGFETTITKIGRSWIYYKDGGRESRFDASTCRIDGGNFTSPGKVYASRAEYEHESEVHQLWTHFRRCLDMKPPANITPERIRQLIEELT